MSKFKVGNFRHLRFEFTGTASDVKAVIDAFANYMEAQKEKPFLVAISLMPADLQEKLKGDIEQIA